MPVGTRLAEACKGLDKILADYQRAEAELKQKIRPSKRALGEALARVLTAIVEEYGKGRPGQSKWASLLRHYEIHPKKAQRALKEVGFVSPWVTEARTRAAKAGREAMTGHRVQSEAPSTDGPDGIADETFEREVRAAMASGLWTDRGQVESVIRWKRATGYGGVLPFGFDPRAGSDYAAGDEGRAFLAGFGGPVGAVSGAVVSGAESGSLSSSGSPEQAGEPHCREDGRGGRRGASSDSLRVRDGDGAAADDCSRAWPRDEFSPLGASAPPCEAGSGEHARVGVGARTDGQGGPVRASGGSDRGGGRHVQIGLDALYEAHERLRCRVDDLLDLVSDGEMSGDDACARIARAIEALGVAR